MAAAKGSEERFAGAMESLVLLAESMQQASALLADADDEDDSSKAQSASFLNIVALGSVGAGKSAVLNSLMGYPVLPTGENGATRAPIVIQLQRGSGSSNRGLYLVVDGRNPSFVTASDVRHSLQGRLKSWTPNARSGRTQGIQLTLQSDAAPPLKLCDIPGLGGTTEDSILRELLE